MKVGILVRKTIWNGDEGAETEEGILRVYASADIAMAAQAAMIAEWDRCAVLAEQGRLAFSREGVGVYLTIKDGEFCVSRWSAHEQKHVTSPLGEQATLERYGVAWEFCRRWRDAPVGTDVLEVDVEDEP